MIRKAAKRNKTSPGRGVDDGNLNGSIRRQAVSRRPGNANVVVVIFMFTMLIFRLSLSPDLTANVISLNYDEFLPRTEDRDFETVATFEKVTQSTPLTTYSYGTTDVKEFKRLHRSYLLSKQEQSNSAYLSTKARGNDINGNPVTTFAFGGNPKGFVAGFRNQIMALTMLVLRANYQGHEQLLLDSLFHKDTYGTNQFEPFDFYFDVEHWNRYSCNGENSQDAESSNRCTSSRGTNQTNPERYPNRLPRMVLYDPTLHDQWDSSRSTYKTENTPKHPTRPYGYTQPGTRLVLSSVLYGRGKGRYVPKPLDLSEQNQKEEILVRNPAEILMLQGALRPHPALQAVVDRSKEHLRERAHRGGIARSAPTKSSFRYMTLHARVEPDMQKHPVCKDKKVLTLQEIVDMVESKWPEPPVDAVFLPINRQYLEEEGTLPEGFKKGDGGINWVAVRNLKLLNNLTNRIDAKDGKSVGGMWNGKVPVVEFGSEALRGTVYEHRPSTSGAILNYFLGLDADIFVGTEVSSFSHDVLAARFFRGFNDSDTTINSQSINGETLKIVGKKNLRQNNYKYLPDGLHQWITDDMESPPGFSC